MPMVLTKRNLPLHQHHLFMYITDMSAFYVLTGQVTYRMTYNQSPHIRVRSGIYHFVRRVPADLQQHYRSDRVSISLRTKSARVASRSAVSISQRLDDYWHGLRLQKMDVPALHLVIGDEADVPDNSPTIMEAVDTYLRLKADKQTPTFIRAAKRNGRYVAEALGNRPITSYSSSDAAACMSFTKGWCLIVTGTGKLDIEMPHRNLLVMARTYISLSLLVQG